DDLYPRSPRTPGEVVLEVRDLGGLAKPRSATLALRRGEVLGIAGLVGAGRTELLRAIFGLDAVRRGEVRVASLRSEGKRQQAKGKGQKEGALRAFLDSSRSDTSLLPFAHRLLPFAFLLARLPSAARLPSHRWRQGVGLVSEDRKTEGLALGLSVTD